MKHYVATRRVSGAHFVLNENYIEEYQDEFERIREFDTPEEAKEACNIRQEVELSERMEKQSVDRIKVSKIRGDIRKGSIEDEELRATIRKELEAELAAEPTKPEPVKSSRPTKKKLE